MSMISIDQGVDMGSQFNGPKLVQGSKKLQLTTIEFQIKLIQTSLYVHHSCGYVVWLCNVISLIENLHLLLFVIHILNHIGD